MISFRAGVILFLFCLVGLAASSQSIRKNFREMTDEEKINLLNGLYALRLGDDLINDLALFHRDFFNFDGTDTPEALDIHINLPDEPERDIFLAWHRMQMLELELAIQEIYPKSSLVYADWRIDSDENSPLWEENFLGQFNDDWVLNRRLGQNSSLPSAELIQSVQTFTSDYRIYSNDLERGNVHSGPHLWIGGAMSSRSSPRDPAFYFHHSFIDKLWQEWEDANGNSVFMRTDMLRYDGTYSFGGNILPLVDPNSIVNTNVLGVFYAENEFVSLHDYVILNRFRSTESFYYQFTIQVGEGFVCPNQSKAEIQSVSEVILKPGFLAESGSEVAISIDVLDPLKHEADFAKSIKRNRIPFDSELVLDTAIAYFADLDDETSEMSIPIKVYPNPFSNELNFEMGNRKGNVRIDIVNLVGSIVFSRDYLAGNPIQIPDLSSLPDGVYFVRLTFSESGVEVFKLLKSE